MNNIDLINKLISEGSLKSDSVMEAFKKVDRADFIPGSHSGNIYGDSPIPIGYGQTNSQPTTVAIMLELLRAKAGEKVLDIGVGSGWTASLLAHIVGEEGIVYGVERIDDLVEFGSANIKKYKFENVFIKKAERSLGYKKEAPYHRILVSAAVKEKPQELIDQLRTNGVMVIPIGYSLWKFEKISDDVVTEEEYPGFSFVPLLAE